MEKRGDGDKEEKEGENEEREERREEVKVEGSANLGSVVREVQADKDSIVSQGGITAPIPNESYSCKLISNYGNPCDHSSCRE